VKSILEIHNISKKFKISHEQPGYLSLRDSLTSLFRPAISTENFYALQDISFNVQPGESVGIIGKNGAGKSTLLKILSKITPPTSGKIILRGRVASLLEVGTGFHPELNGRENVFLNGSILGMKRREIQSKFDEIIDFSGTEKFMDTPLKHFSSGMQLRLAFAVAAFLEPEILIIDEVLAVGDAEFQKKCLGKMEDVSKSGRTILFVSHQMGMISQLCTKALLLEKGKIVTSGKANEVVNYYSEKNLAGSESYRINHEPLDKDIYITNASMLNGSGKTTSHFAFNEDYKLKISFKVKKPVKHSVLGFIVKDKYGNKIFTSQVDLDRYHISEGGIKEYTAMISFPNSLLTPNPYTILGAVHIPNIRVIDQVDTICVLNIIDTGSNLSMYEGRDHGCVFANCEWNLSQN
jgi:lipopolysaccharide transport system ATP-binding protein